jgi:hypothetical protein
MCEEIDSNRVAGRRTMSQTQEPALSVSTKLYTLPGVRCNSSFEFGGSVASEQDASRKDKPTVIDMRGTKEERLPLLNRSVEAKTEENIGA